MDQTLINWVFAGGGAAFGWVLKVIWDAIKELKADMKQIERDLPEIYVRKDDFKAAMIDIKDDFKELKHDMKDGFNKIDSTLGLLFKKLETKLTKE
jgi:inhibitor of KinA sporulation pathway (predicted exonuclease)